MAKDKEAKAPADAGERNDGPNDAASSGGQHATGAAYAQERAGNAPEDLPMARGGNDMPRQTHGGWPGETGADGNLLRIDQELQRIGAVVNGIADLVDRHGGELDEQKAALAQIAESVGGLQKLVETLGARLSQAEERPAGGGESLADVLERIKVLETRPGGALTPEQQKAVNDQALKQASANAQGERMLYHETKPPMKVTTAAQSKRAHESGYRESILEAAGGDAEKAAAIHARAGSERHVNAA